MLAHLSFLKRWWFWALLLVALITAWQVRERLTWNEQQQGYLLQQQITTDYWHTQQRLVAEREAAYKADQYGGATPEETLRLFVEALEQKDYVLASKYFVVEEQNANLKRSSEGVQSGGYAALVNAYKHGSMKIERSTIAADVHIYPPGKEIGFFFRVVLNEFTQKWKLTDN